MDDQSLLKTEQILRRKRSLLGSDSGEFGKQHTSSLLENRSLHVLAGYNVGIVAEVFLTRNPVLYM